MKVPHSTLEKNSNDIQLFTYKPIIMLREEWLSDFKQTHWAHQQEEQQQQTREGREWNFEVARLTRLTQLYLIYLFNSFENPLKMFQSEFEWADYQNVFNGRETQQHLFEWLKIAISEIWKNDKWETHCRLIHLD